MFLMFGTLIQSILVMKSAAAAWPESVVSESRKSYCLLLNCCTTSAALDVAFEIILIEAPRVLRGEAARLCLPIQPG